MFEVYICIEAHMVSGGIHSPTQFGLDNIVSLPPTYILYSTLTRLFVTFFCLLVL